jgi:phosphatidylethanolamine-binding protein (PEBP) family uncharacterized protein
MEYVERTLSYLTKNRKGYDAQLFTKGPALSSFPEPTITITSPDCGPSDSMLDIDHTQDGKDLIPSLNWTLPSTIPISEVAEYLLVIEDVDAPIGCIMHAAFYSIPPTKTTLTHEDIQKVDGKGKGNELKGGFRYAKNLRSTPYSGPKPLKGHGSHRYFFQVLALKEKLGQMTVPAKMAELVSGVEGKVLGWGSWTGVAERK